MFSRTEISFFKIGIWKKVALFFKEDFFFFGRGRAAPPASIRQMSRQVSRGSAGEFQADEQAGVARLSW